MRAVAYRLRRLLRANWRSAAGSIGVVALASATILALAAGAQRTSTAPDRYVAASTGDAEALVTQHSGRPVTAEVESLPGVAAVDSITFFFGSLSRDGVDDRSSAGTLAGSSTSSGMRLVSGRTPNPDQPGEFVATPEFLKANRASIGDHFDLVTLSPEQSGAQGFGNAAPEGPTLEAVLVGVIDGPNQLDDPSTTAIFSAATLDLDHMGVALTLMGVHLRPGVDLTELRRQLDGLPDGDSLSLEPSEPVSAAVRTAVDAQARALWLLALGGAIGVVAVLGQLITRQVRLSATEHLRLAAVGFTDRQIAGETVARAAVPIIIGVVLGAAIAPFASGIFPTSFVRRVEPTPGVRLEATVVFLGALALMLALLAWSAVALRAHRPVSRRPSVLLDRAAAFSASATASTGLRLAFARTSRDRGSVRTAVIGLVAILAVVAGTATFATSLDRLVREPARFGANYDMLYDVGADEVPAELIDAFDQDPDVAALTLVSSGQARVGDDTLRVIGLEPVRGAIAPRVLAGRLPVGGDEIALGRLAGKSLSVKVGDALTLDAGGRSLTFRVTGLVVVPSIGSNAGVGQDGVVTPDGMARLDATARPAAALLSIRAGAPRRTFDRLARLMGVDPTDFAEEPIGSRPASIINVARARAIPIFLAALFGALAVLTVAHVMLTSIRNRRRDIAVLSALGADRGWLTRAVHWQATSVALLPAVVGLPIGVLAGRLVFRVFADSIGAVDDATTPLLLTLAVGGGLLVLANAAAVLPARRARHLPPAAVLQAE
jgi:hypothetical protein